MMVIPSFALPAAVTVALVYVPEVPTDDICASIDAIFVSIDPSSSYKVRIPMKKVPAVVTLPLIKSSNTMATEHVVAEIEFSKSDDFVKPITPETRARRMAIIRTIVGQYNSHLEYGI